MVFDINNSGSIIYQYSPVIFFSGIELRMFPIRQSYAVAFVIKCNRFLYVSVDFYDADISKYQ